MLIPTSNHQDAIKIPGAWMVQLMLRNKLNWTWKVKPEEKESIDLADFMRKQTLEGHFKGIWWHTPNEGKRHQITACIMKAMGMLAGVPDFIFIWRNQGLHVAFIEMKAGNNKQSTAQKNFQKWADYWMIPYAVHYSADEAAYQLKEWGAV